MRRLAIRVLGLYPRRWRDRYESEMRALLEEYPVRLRTLMDLMGGGVRAHLEEEEPMARKPTRHVRCSFCGKGRDQVKRLVAGPGVYICCTCVALCNEVLANDGPADEPPAPTTPPRRPDMPPDIPKVLRTWLRNVFRSAVQRTAPASSR